MTQLSLILFFTLCSNGYDCIPKGNSNTEGFYGSSGCETNANSFSYYFNISITRTISIGLIVESLYFENEITMTNNKGWRNANNFTFLPNSQVSFYGGFHSANKIYFHSNSKALIFGPFSIGNQVSFESTPLLDYPPLVFWKSTYVHLYTTSSNGNKFSIVNPNSNNRCFDVVSFGNINALDFYSSRNNHYSSYDFPINMSDGIAHLISNKRLLRFCPNGINLNKIVTCVMNGTVYSESYLGSGSYSFTYPHCPCNDDTTDCHLIFDGYKSSFNMNNRDLTNTTIYVNHDVTLSNLIQPKKNTT